MRFLPGGIDLPAELVTAQEKGEVLFVCGAGVSKRAGIPLFWELVDQVYRQLGEDHSRHPAEAAMMAPTGPNARQYDRVLRELERRLAGSRHPQLRRMRDEIRRAVATALTIPPDANLQSHCIVMKLSRDDQARTRVVTTNFDTLLERAGRKLGLTDLRSHAGPALPLPRGDAFTGVLHLHGRLQDDEVGLPPSDLVLNSAEFGDAYLRTGWASRYVYDLARSYVLVFVGYGVDDPPMRYLLEALEADRERYRDLRTPFAFADAGPGDEALQQALWRAKGIEPILYSAAPPEKHGRLYNTLEAWSQYAEDPTSWRLSRLRSLVSRAPSQLTPDEQAPVPSLLSHADAARLLRDSSPAAPWVPVLHKAGVFAPNRDARPSPVPWIAGRLGDADLIRACVDAPLFSATDLDRLGSALDRADGIPDECRRAWRFIRRARMTAPQSPLVPPWYRVASRVKAGDIDAEVRAAVAASFRPSLQVRQALPRKDDEGNVLSGTPKLSNLLRIRFEPVERHLPEIDAVLAHWPETVEQEGALLRALARTLEGALDEARDAGLVGGAEDIDLRVSFVSRGMGRAYGHGFTPLVHLLTAVWDRFAPKAPSEARALASWWAATPFGLLRRLHLYALSTKEVFDADVVAQVLVELGDQAFWFGESRREVASLTAARWSSFGQPLRSALESRLRAGPPRALFSPAALADDAGWERVRDEQIFVRFEHIRAEGGVLEDATASLLESLAARDPRLSSRTAASASSPNAVTVFYGPQGDPAVLAGVPDGQLVAEAFRLQGEGGFRQSDLWELFCKGNPEHALAGLCADAAAGRWLVPAWQGLLWAAAKAEGPDFQAELASAVLSIPASELTGALLGTLVHWLHERRSLLSPKELAPSAVVLALWDRFATPVFGQSSGELEMSDEGDAEDSAALNEPGGKLAWVLIDALNDAGELTESAFAELFKPRLARVLEAPGRQGMLGRVFLAKQLPFLFSVQRAWTTQKLVPLFGTADLEAAVLWRARLRGAPIWDPALFNALKPDLMRIASKWDGRRPELEAATEQLLLPVIYQPRLAQGEAFNIDPLEVRAFLAGTSPEARQQAASRFFHIAKDAKGSGAEVWRTLLAPSFTKVWPMDAACRDGRSSSFLAQMALECGDAFPEALNAILNVLVPYEMYEVGNELRLDERGQSAARKFPKAFLELLNAVIDPDWTPPPSDLGAELAACVAAEPSLESHQAYLRLRGIARRIDA